MPLTARDDVALPDTDSEPDTLRAALTYASRGWPVAPAHSVDNDGVCTCKQGGCGTYIDGKLVGSPGKHPLTAHGLKDASLDPGVIRGWWAKWPHANVLVRTGKIGDRHLVALDIDVSITRHGDETLAALIAEHGDLPPTPQCVTGGGGQHIFFWSHRPCPNSVDKVGDGLDIRGEGGYVVAAPSRHRSGRSYEWEASAHPAEVDLAEAPSWLLDLAGRYRKPADVGNVEVGDFIIGKRNSALTQLAGHMRRPGIGPKAILAALLVENETKCKPPLDPAEVRRIAESIGRNAPGAPIVVEMSHSEKYPMLGAMDLAIEDPPTPWICNELKIAPGAVTLIGGSGFGGKTVSMQSLAMSVASGLPLWGQFKIAKGRAIHLDYEQGLPLTKRRYQRIARSMDLQWKNLADSNAIGLTCLPNGSLSDRDALEHVTRICSGAVVCIVDSFRAAFPAAKENDSEAAAYLHMLSRASDKTGCAMLVIMHTRKAGEDKDLRNSLRGSAALYDASQSVFMLNGEQAKPTQVHHLKERLEGELTEMFGLTVSDVPHAWDPNDRKWGLKVSYVPTSEVNAAYALETSYEDQIAANEQSLASLIARIVDNVRSAGPDGLVGATLSTRFGRSAAHVAAALSQAVHSGLIRQDGKGSSAVFYV